VIGLKTTTLWRILWGIDLLGGFGFMGLQGKRILITGASSGIGYALVRQLLKVPGVRIVGVARNIKSLRRINSDRLFALSLDVTKPRNVEFMLDEAISLMGGTDIIIACAGFGYYEKFENLDYGHIKRIFETNVLSPLFTLSRFLEKQKYGDISFVMISSALGKFGLAGYALYCSTKFALNGFAESFRFEPQAYGPQKRLHFMAVYPIGVKTNFFERIHTDMPLPRPLQSPNTAAKAIIKGLKKKKRRVYTSKLSYLLPFTFRAYQAIHKKKFIKFLIRKSLPNLSFLEMMVVGWIPPIPAPSPAAGCESLIYYAAFGYHARPYVVPIQKIFARLGLDCAVTNIWILDWVNINSPPETMPRNRCCARYVAEIKGMGIIGLHG
jgi:short-subunit dehydrogenase